MAMKHYYIGRAQGIKDNETRDIRQEELGMRKKEEERRDLAFKETMSDKRAQEDFARQRDVTLKFINLHNNVGEDKRNNAIQEFNRQNGTRFGGMKFTDDGGFEITDIQGNKLVDGDRKTYALIQSELRQQNRQEEANQRAIDLAKRKTEFNLGKEKELAEYKDQLSGKRDEYKSKLKIKEEQEATKQKIMLEQAKQMASQGITEKTPAQRVASGLKIKDITKVPKPELDLIFTAHGIDIDQVYTEDDKTGKPVINPEFVKYYNWIKNNNYNNLPDSSLVKIAAENFGVKNVEEQVVSIKRELSEKGGYREIKSRIDNALERARKKQPLLEEDKELVNYEAIAIHQGEQVKAPQLSEKAKQMITDAKEREQRYLEAVKRYNKVKELNAKIREAELNKLTIDITQLPELWQAFEDYKNSPRKQEDLDSLRTVALDLVHRKYGRLPYAEYEAVKRRVVKMLDDAATGNGKKVDLSKLD